MEKDRYLLSSLNNALCLLDLLSHASSLSLAELTHLSGMDKASVFRSLYTLEKNGYVQKLPEARYRLGMKFLLRKLGGGTAGYRDGSSTRPAESDPAVQAGGTPLLPQSGTDCHYL